MTSLIILIPDSLTTLLQCQSSLLRNQPILSDTRSRPTPCRTHCSRIDCSFETGLAGWGGSRTRTTASGICVPLPSLLSCLAERPDRARALRTIRCLSLRRTNNARPNRARFCSGSTQPVPSPRGMSWLRNTGDIPRVSCTCLRESSFQAACRSCSLSCSWLAVE